eukprot:gene7139-7944_t
MAEAKRFEIHFLDERKLEMQIQPKLLSSDLLDIVVSHFSLREKEYFGIWYLDDVNQKKWLRSEKKVLDHNFQKNTNPVMLAFGVRLFVPSFTFLKESSTVELFYLQAIKSIAQGELVCDYKTLFLLAAYVMQAKNGDYISESISNDDFTSMNIIPKDASSTTSMNGCPNEIASHYKRMTGLQRGDAIVNYLNIVERLPMYGIQFYNVKDKNEIFWKIGVSHRGIGVYDLEEYIDTKEIYTWNRIENLFYRDKKFSLEIRNLSRSGSNNSINSLGRYSTIRNRSGQKLDVVTWSLMNSADCREIWSISVGYHQLYVNTRGQQLVENKKTLKDIARELTRSTSSLALSVDSNGSNTINTHNNVTLMKEMNTNAVGQLINALNLRKQFLKSLLEESNKKLKNLSSWESSLINGRDVQADIQEKCMEMMLENDVDCKKKEIKKLTRDFEIQYQILEAAKMLSQDEKLCRTKVKEKQVLHKKAASKLRLLEAKLDELQNYVNETGTHLFQDEFNAEMYTETFDGHAANHEGRACQGKPPLPYDTQRRYRKDRNPDRKGKVIKIQEKTIDESMYTRPNTKGKYLCGEFGNSGVYSVLKNGNINKLSNCSPNLHGSSSSLSMLSKTSVDGTESDSKFHATVDKQKENKSRPGFNRWQSEDASSVYSRIKDTGPPRRTSESNLSKYAFGRTSNSSNDSSFTSVLSGAAWSQLSQPSLETLAQDYLYTPIPLSRPREAGSKENDAMGNGEDEETTTTLV